MGVTGTEMGENGATWAAVATCVEIQMNTAVHNMGTKILHYFSIAWAMYLSSMKYERNNTIEAKRHVCFVSPFLHAVLLFGAHVLPNRK